MRRGPADERQPAAAHNDTADEYLVVWVDGRRTPDRGTDIFGQRVALDGTRLGRAFRISGSAAVGSDHQPTLAFNSTDNEYLVAWADRRNEAARGWEIYAQRLSANGERLGHNIRLSGERATDDEWRPAVAFSVADETYAVVWMDGRKPSTPGSDVYGQLVSATGERLGHNFWITGSALADTPRGERFIPVGGPAVAYNDVGNEFFVAWPDRREKPTTNAKVIYGRRVSTAGTHIGDDVRVSGSNTFDDRWPALAYNKHSNEYLVVWTSDIWGDAAFVFGRRVSATGQPLAEPIEITDGESFHVKTPTVAFDSAHHSYLVAWQDDRYQVSDNVPRWAAIFGQFVSAAGQPQGGNFTIPGVASRRAGEPVLTYGPADDGYLAVWTDWRRSKTRGADIYGQLLS